MPRHAETRPLPYSPEQMFDLVADVGRYQDFLPWVAATRIRQRDEKSILADLIVGFGPLRETFTSRVALDRPKAIDVDYVEGPLKQLHNSWRFAPDGKVSNVERFGLDRGRVVLLSRRVSDQGVSAAGALRQLLGNFGRLRADQLLNGGG